MNRTPLTRASNIKSAGYDVESFTLQVEFKKGEVYEYYNVPKQIAESLLRRDVVDGGDPGKFFYYHIRSKFQYKKIEERKD